MSESLTTAASTGSDAAAADQSGVKETIESIVVAFILAFIFRGFVVEAFVIPTGSMATTLLGAHMRFHCPDCGFRFDVNYQNESGDPDDVNVPRYAVVQTGGRTENRVYSIVCPNCGFKLPRNDAADSNNDATAPPIRYGDRILVLKYLYLFQDPQRWDVVVFKSPAQPNRWDYSQNYIKRLVGRPGEAVMILDGDAYVGPHDGKAEDFVVQGKPRIVQKALWRLVNDNDYQPQGLDRAETNQYGAVSQKLPPWRQPWSKLDGGAGWDLTGGRVFRFDNREGTGTIYFDPEANPQTNALTDWLAYDATWDGRGRSRADTYQRPAGEAWTYEPLANVSDIKVEFYYERTSGDGPLQVQITKHAHTFTAEITPTTATLFMREGDGRPGLGDPIGTAVPIKPPRDRPMQVELTNVDYRVTLRIDGRDIIATTPPQYAPEIQHLLEVFHKGLPSKFPRPQIRLTAQNQAAVISHLSLWRDVFYINRGDRSDQGRRVGPFWASPEDFPENVIKLGSDEYFVLGDNALISGDARTWGEDIHLPQESLEVESGRVPGRFLLGKAFFVYWPAGYRPIDSAPALAPNFGDMRFIH
jgi:signal peptidase I